jgi:hypothetical protein
MVVFIEYHLLFVTSDVGYPPVLLDGVVDELLRAAPGARASLACALGRGADLFLEDCLSLNV